MNYSRRSKGIVLVATIVLSVSILAVNAGLFGVAICDECLCTIYTGSCHCLVEHACENTTGQCDSICDLGILCDSEHYCLDKEYCKGECWYEDCPCEGFGCGTGFPNCPDKICYYGMGGNCPLGTCMEK